MKVYWKLQVIHNNQNLIRSAAPIHVGQMRAPMETSLTLAPYAGHMTASVG